jgi:hypothetical protein
MTIIPPPILDLAHLDDAGFDQLYREEIEQPLLAREAERHAGVSTFWSRLIPGCGILLPIAYFAWDFGYTGIAFVGLFIGLTGVATLAYWPLSDLYDQVKYRMLTTIADAMGCHYKSVGFQIDVIPRMLELGLLPHYDRDSYEDCFTGERFKCSFDLFEAHLEEKYQTKNGTSWRTVFRGQIVRVAFPKHFLGVTVVWRNLGLLNFLNHFGNKLQRVGLEDVKFERDFEVYGSDQVEARELVHPVFMERLLALETAYDGKRLRCGFQNGDLLLAVEGRDRFELGSMFTPLADPKRVRTVVDDIAEVLRLIDSMLTAERAPLIALGNKNVPAEG